jgi:8-oxo-dGTP pyrophosphatase MutT (NUDIX family)
MGQMVTFVPGHCPEDVLNGVRLSTWADAPHTSAAWNVLVENGVSEPPFIVPAGKRAAAGAIVVEPDGRVWLTAPSNGFAGYQATFPKGRVDSGMTLQATAIKECYEESGLHVELIAFIGDYSRSLTHTRFYLARRVGGTPADMGWESQAVHLVPPSKILAVLNQINDHVVALAIERTMREYPATLQALCRPGIRFCLDAKA